MKGVLSNWRRPALVSSCRALWAGLFLAFSLSVQAREAGQAWLSDYIQPNMHAFEMSARKVEASLAALCAQSLPSRPDAVHGAANELARQAGADFKALVLSWSRIEFLRFGPLVEANRYERISYWPDPRHVMQRQLPGVLARYSRGELVDLSTQSVAVQGLPALEYLLYGTQGLLLEVDGLNGVPTDPVAEPDSGAVVARCHYAADITRNLAGLGGALSSAWASGGVWADGFASPAPGRETYRGPSEVLAESIKALSAGVQFAADVKIGSALAVGRSGSTLSRGSVPANGSPPRGDAVPVLNLQRLPWWRSGLQAAALAATLQGLKAYYAAGHLALGTAAWAGAQWQAELQQAVNLIEANGTESGVWQAARLVLVNAKRVLDEDVAPALGVGLGFNALDGD